MQYFSGRQRMRLARALITKNSPAYVQYYITARCNLACEQCNIIYAHADSPEIGVDQIRMMASNLSEIGVCVVLLIGGEPFVRKDIAEIVKAFVDAGIHVRLQTNGLATREALVDCVRAGAHDISVSLDSLSPIVQDTINGGYPRSWKRALKTITLINDVFPENGSAFFGTVLMPRNLDHIRGVIEFATAIGWGVSLVPVHVSRPEKPMGFRAVEIDGTCTFAPEDLPRVREVLQEVKRLRKSGHNVYDSDEYLDDMYRFVAGTPLRWRRRNGGVCDSPNLYFAIEPDGNLSPCCDYRLSEKLPTYDPDFPKWYRTGVVDRAVTPFTQQCSGCMYGSYPEITITARFMSELLKRLVYFNVRMPALKRISEGEIQDLAASIHQKHAPSSRHVAAANGGD